MSMLAAHVTFHLNRTETSVFKFISCSVVELRSSDGVPKQQAGCGARAHPPPTRPRVPLGTQASGDWLHSLWF